jgi:hypothetical protein
VSDILARFLDGPLSGKGNIRNEGGGHDFVLREEVFGWPLPERMRALTHHGVDNVALWDAESPEGSGLPEEITGSPNAVTYRKVAESKITDHAIAEMTHVIRGAQYRLEPVPTNGQPATQTRAGRPASEKQSKPDHSASTMRAIVDRMKLS